MDVEPVQVLVVNTGSSSVKLRLLDGRDEVLSERHVERWDSGDLDPVRDTLDDWDIRPRGAGPPLAVGHRVVHGGPGHTAAARIDDSLVRDLEALADLAPLHQPRAVAGIRAVQALLPHTPAVACFDTAFHGTIPTAAATYALPQSWRERWGLRRYGFHGLSHAYAARRGAELVGAPPTLRTVTAHLGAGASLAAVVDGRSVDTTMGFTPLEGLVMATRSGSVDPGMLLWLLREGRLDLDELETGLEHRSGLAGLSGTGGDLRDVLAALDGPAGAQQDAARLAFDVFVHRLCREIAAMAAAACGLDLLVFTGGIGEHAPRLRTEVARRLGWLGVGVDAEANERLDVARDGDTEITAPATAVRTVVVAAREDLEIAGQVRALLAPT